MTFYTNFLSRLHGFRDNDVLLHARYGVIVWFFRQGVLPANFYDEFWKSDHDFLIVIQSNFLFMIHGFRGNEVLLQARYDVIVTSSLGAAPANFQVLFWWSDHDFLIVFYTNFLSKMHGSRDNGVLMQPGYDVTAISPPGGAYGEFSWRTLEERPWLPDSIPYQHFV